MGSNPTERKDLYDKILARTNMNFVEVAILIAERGEMVTAERVSSILTNKFSYIRTPEGEWEQRELPPPVDNTQYLPIVPTEKKETK